jgi:calcium/calmodulin-dependent protein kinase I
MPQRADITYKDGRNPSIERRESSIDMASSRTLFYASPPHPPDDDNSDEQHESFVATVEPLHHRQPLSARVGEIFRERSLLMNPRLTLSAFRRPENSFRLTSSDPSRSLEYEYSLHEPNCCGVLGHGAFSTVRLGVRRKDGGKVAVKSIAKHEALRSRRLRVRGRAYVEEWEILRRMNHNPYVVSLLDVFETDDEIQLVTEYCQGGELFDAIQKKRKRSHSMRRGQYTEAQASRITKQLLLVLSDLHSQGIVHRDVKAENILLCTDSDDASVHVKLCDFGMARVIREPGGDLSPLTPGRTQSFSLVGSDYYMAPEVCCGGTYDTAVDIYSLGVTLYILLCGFPPVFSGDEAEEVIFPQSYWKDISDNAKALVRTMLLPDVSERPSARECLQHEWITHSHTSVEGNNEREETSRINEMRQRLYSTLGGSGGPSNEKISDMLLSPKRRRVERRASATLMALADMYRGVATSTPSTSSVAARTGASPAQNQRTPTSFSGPTTVAALSF